MWARKSNKKTYIYSINKVIYIFEIIYYLGRCITHRFKENGNVLISI